MTSVETRLIELDTIQAAIGRADALAVVRETLRRLAAGEVTVPVPLGLQTTEGEVHVKGAAFAGSPYLVFKVATGFPGNAATGRPVNDGFIMVLDAQTGALHAQLADHGWLTDLRTAAAGALAAQLLARPDAHVAAVLGAGGQARFQLAALAEVRELTKVHVWARRSDQARRYAAEMSEQLGIEVVVADTVRAAVEAADILVTTTSSREPLVRAEWLRPGTHITAMGSDFADKQELDAEVLGRADLVVADSVRDCAESGELHHALAAGVLRTDQVVELSDVVSGASVGRTGPEQITVADQCGLGAYDAAVVEFVLGPSAPAAREGQERSDPVRSPERRAAKGTASAADRTVTSTDLAKRAEEFAPRLREHLVLTPLVEFAGLSDQWGVEVLVKCEHQQRTGSFKARGSLAKLLTLTEEQRARGVVTASSGNHGLGVAHGLSVLGGQGIVFVPENAAPVKVAAIRRFGAEVRSQGRDSGLLELVAREYAAEHGLTYVPPYNDPDVIAGQGTIGVELVEQLAGRAVDAVFVAVGGGGLISGITSVLRQYLPGVRICGASPANDASMIASVRAGQAVGVDGLPTLSDGTAGTVEDGSITVELCRSLVDEWMLVEEEEIRAALRGVIDLEHQLVEGSAGVAFAAAGRAVRAGPTGRIVVVSCGGNVSAETLSAALSR
jgi:threonine dehydratase